MRHFSILILSCCSVNAAPVWHTIADVSYAEMTNIIATANSGDVIYVPASISGYSAGLLVDKGLIFVSEGAEIVDNLASGSLLRIEREASDIPVRFSGFRFVHGSRVNDQDNGVIVLAGGSSANTHTNWWVRVDHCYFYNLKGNAIVTQDAYGVFDHNDCYNRTGQQFTYHNAAKFNGGDHGDGSWAAPLDIANDRRWIQEDNTFSKANPFAGSTWVTDGSDGCRWLFRFNTVNHNMILECHGTDSSGRDRGGVSVIAYGNSFIGNNTGGLWGNARSGNWLVCSNALSGYSGAASITLDAHRLHNNFTNTWGGAQGTNIFDVNYSGGPFTTGMASAVGTRTLTVSGSPWTSGQWLTYSVIRTSGSSSGTTFGFIVGSTANSISWAGNSFSADLSFQVGETFAMYRVQHTLDMVGRTGGALFSGNPPIIPGVTNAQTTELCYSWNNLIIDQGSVNARFVVAAADASIVEGVHYTNGVAKPGFTTFTYPHPLSSQTQSIAISPSVATVAASSSVDFDMTGGNGTNLIWHVWVNNSGASINSSTGLYTAGATTNVLDTVRTWDTYGNFKDALVSVGVEASPTITRPSIPKLRRRL